jgi:prepilin signal peptidase PulO-like enzyme (type II secretory pathway)
VGIILGALFFGIAGFVGVLLGGTIKTEPFHDGPAPSEPPIAWIIAGCAVIGAIVATHTSNAEQVVVSALAAIWCTDVRYGIVPDIFTLGPLALIFFIALLQQQPWPFLYAAVPFVPFAITALISKGRGMGWGDVKLAALGGAVLGAETALLAFAAGCLLAVVYAYLRGRRAQPIAFAPYMAGAIGFAIPLVTLR